MLHRFVAIFLSFLYLCAFSGATVTVHYCFGNISSVSFTETVHVHDMNCHTCQKKKKTCCEDKQTVLQVQGKHEPSAQVFAFEKIKLAIPSAEFHEVDLSWKLTPVYLSYLTDTQNDSPPQIPLYISYCVYKI